MQQKTNYTLFHKTSTKDDIALKIPELVISTKLIKRKKIYKILRCYDWWIHHI